MNEGEGLRKKSNQSTVTYPNTLAYNWMSFTVQEFFISRWNYDEDWEAWRSRKQPDCIDVGDRLFLSELWWFSSLFYMRKLEIVLFLGQSIIVLWPESCLLLPWWDGIELRIRKHYRTWVSKSKPIQYEWYHGSFWSTWAGEDEKYSV